jgi:two-component system cell cycle sensor histidine kinase/response regulator CckA
LAAHDPSERRPDRRFSKRQRAEDALRDSEARLHAAILHAHITLFSQDLDLRYTWFQSARPSVRSEDVLGKTDAELVAPEDAARVIALKRRVIDSGSPLREEVGVQLLGRMRHYDCAVEPLRDAGGRIVGITGAAWDITEREEEEVSLGRAEFIVDHLQDFIHLVSPEGRFLYVNDASCRRLGYSREELLGMTVGDVDPAAPRPYSGHFQDVRERGSFTFESLRKTKDGEVFPVEVTVNYVNYRGQEYNCASAREITDRKRAERALRLTEFSVNRVADMISWLDREGHFLFVNDAICQHLGYTREELLGLTVWDVDPNILDSWHERWLDVMKHGSRSFESVFRTKTGEHFPAEVTTNHIEYEGQEYLVTLSRDITERKQAEQLLKDEISRRRLLVEHSRDGIVVLDEEGGVYEANQEYARMLGYSMEEVYQLHVWDWESQYTKEQIMEMLRAVDESGDHFETRHRRKDGTFCEVEISTNGAVYGGKKLVFCVCRDITERLRAEEERLQLERQLLHSQKLESMGILAGGIAHDFNNILTIVLGNADLALSDLPASAPARRNLLEIIQASRRAAALSHQMLAYSGRGHFAREPVDLNALIEGMLNLVQSSVSKKALLRLNLAKGLPPMLGDPGQLNQVIMNLVINASEAIGEQDGGITISTGVKEYACGQMSESYATQELAPGPYLTLDVSDTGCGMDAETREHLFEPFFTTKFTGRGLGLAAVLGIVRGHKGAIEVVSQPGRGTTVRICFPAAETEAGAALRRTEVVATGWRGEGTVLLVDDEEAIRTMGADLLASLGFAVLTAADGREALELYREHTDDIALILLDLTMPHMDGEETLRELRRLDPRVRVVMSTGYTGHDIASRFDAQNPVGFVQKPYTLAELEAQLRAVLTRS